MRGERQLLRLGEYLVGRASRRLPRRIRAERYREWSAELPVILHDPQISLAPRRAVRMVVYAADTLRGTALMHVRGQRRSARLLTAVGVVLVAAGLALASLSGQGVQYRDWVNYLMAATLALVFPALWLVSPWARARRAQYRKT